MKSYLRTLELGLALALGSLAPAVAQAPSAGPAQAPPPLPAASPSNPGSPTADLEAVLAARPVVNQSLSLEQAVSLALQESPIVRGAEQEVVAAEARVKGARAERYPWLSVNGFGSAGSGPNILGTPEPVRPSMLMAVPRGPFYDANLSLMLPLFTGGRLKAMVRQAKAQQGASQADLQSQRQDIALAVRIAYRDATARKSLVDVASAAVAQSQERLRIDRLSLEQDRIPRYFVLRDEAQVASDQQTLTNAQRDLDLSLIQLKTVMGVNLNSRLELTDALGFEPAAAVLSDLTGEPAETPPPGAGPEGSQPGGNPPEGAPRATPSGPAQPEAGAAPGEGARPAESPTGAPETAPGAPEAGMPAEGAQPGVQVPAVPALPPASPVVGSAPDPALAKLLAVAERTRPELAAAGLRVQAARQGVSGARSAFLPQVGLSVMGDVMKQRGEPTRSGNTLGIVVSFPLWDAGARRARVGEARALQQRSEQERQRVGLQVGQDVSDALLGLRAAEQNVHTAEAGVASAEEGYRVTLLRYQSGLGLNVEVLDAEATLTRARNDRVQALYEYNVAQDQLRRALGVLVSPTEA